jgi:hypothetical protein
MHVGLLLNLPAAVVLVGLAWRRLTCHEGGGGGGGLAREKRVVGRAVDSAAERAAALAAEAEASDARDWRRNVRQPEVEAAWEKFADRCETQGLETHSRLRGAVPWATLTHSLTHHGGGRVVFRSIIDEFVTSLWWKHITDDEQGPGAMRRSLLGLFGNLARRARKVDLAELLLRCRPR